MKLANALSQRAELQTRIHQLESRLYNNAQVQEGEQPAEDPEELLRELEENYTRLEDLISAINRTNSTARTASRESWAFCGTSWKTPVPWSGGVPPVRSR